MEVEGVGQQEQQGDQRDDEEGDEVNGEVEEIRNSTHDEMTHARAMWDECEPELWSALEPMQCDQPQGKTVKGR